MVKKHKHQMEQLPMVWAGSAFSRVREKSKGYTHLMQDSYLC